MNDNYTNPFDTIPANDFADALARLPKYVSRLCRVFAKRVDPSLDDVDPDVMLNNIIMKMKANSYSEKDIEKFATVWMKLMIENSDVFYSSMHLRLFSEHFGGTHVAIKGKKGFLKALAHIPDYVAFILSFRMFGDEYDRRFDPDEVLYNLVLKMREHLYTESEISLFVTRWLNEIEDLGEKCNSLMYTYLFGKFVFKHEKCEIQLAENKKCIGCAFAYVPYWFEYLTDTSVNYYLGYDEYDIIPLIINMKEECYPEDEIETLIFIFLEEAANIPHCNYAKHIKNRLLVEAKTEPWLEHYARVFDKFI